MLMIVDGTLQITYYLKSSNRVMLQAEEATLKNVEGTYLLPLCTSRVSTVTMIYIH